MLISLESLSICHFFVIRLSLLFLTSCSFLSVMLLVPKIIRGLFPKFTLTNALENLIHELFRHLCVVDDLWALQVLGVMVRVRGLGIRLGLGFRIRVRV